MIKYIKPIIKAVVPQTAKPLILTVLYKIRTPFYIGNRVHCPCCGGNFSKFLSFVSYKVVRKNAQCPQCGSLERHRLLWLYLQNETTILSDQLRVLHFAPEYIVQKRLQKFKNLDYISTDFSSPLAKVKMDIQNIIYEDNFIDCILCFHVLDHVADDNRAIYELYRVLRPGGWAIIQSSVDLSMEKTFEDPTATTTKERLKIYGQIDLARKYGRDFVTRLIAPGLIVKPIQYGREIGEDLSKKYGISINDTFYYCTKPAL